MNLIKGRELLGEVFEVLNTKQGIEELAGLKNGNGEDARPPISSTRQSLYPIPGCGAFSILISYFLRSHFLPSKQVKPQFH